MRIFKLSLLSILFFACGNTTPEMNLLHEGGIMEEADMEAGVLERGNGKDTGVEELVKKVVKTGSINFLSDDVAKDYKRVKELLNKQDAYIELETESNTSQTINYSMTIRVVSENYDSLFNELSNIAKQIDTKSSHIEDVTERYYDLKTRIKNKKALEQRYIELLTKAPTIKDILEIEKSLNDIRNEIERFEGQFNFLSKQVSYSVIHLNFYEYLPYTHNTTKKGFGARVLSALDGGWQGFLSFLVGLARLWPFILLLIGGIYLVRKTRAFWKRKK